MMTHTNVRFRGFRSLGIVCLAIIGASPSVARAQIVEPGVYGWGANYYGQVGNGTVTVTGADGLISPVPITALSGLNVTAVVGGAAHSLAVTSAGAVYDWGYNFDGELGNGTTTNSSTPARVTTGGLSGINITAVAGGGEFTLALTNTGAVYDWGYNNDGELGNGTAGRSTSPVHITGGGLSGVNIKAVAAGGGHSLALTSGGSVYAWGANASGQVGNGSLTNSLTPVSVSALSGVNVTALAAGNLHSLALTGTGTVYAWGDNTDGQLGNGTTTRSSTPVAVAGFSGIDVSAVAEGASHNLALTSTGAVYAWGFNNDGQLGNGTQTGNGVNANALTPLLVSFPANGSATVVSISAGEFTSFALESDGSLWAWGDNSYGEYGNGTITSSLTPIEVFTPTGGFGISEFAEGEVGFQSLAIVTPVPEPGSLCLVVGVACFAGFRRLRSIRLRPRIPLTGLPWRLRSNSTSAKPPIAVQHPHARREFGKPTHFWTFGCSDSGSGPVQSISTAMPACRMFRYATLAFCRTICHCRRLVVWSRSSCDPGQQTSPGRLPWAAPTCQGF